MTRPSPSSSRLAARLTPPSPPVRAHPVHHTKHHQTYVNGLNAAEEAYAKALEASDVLQLIKLQSALKFNGGGPSLPPPPPLAP